MINKKYLYVFEDYNGLPILSIVGPEDYCIKSIGNMLSEENTKNMPSDVKDCLLAGRVRVERVYCDYIHDNKVAKNRSDSVYLGFTIDIKDLIISDFFIDKTISKKYHKEFSRADRQYNSCLIAIKNLIKKEEEIEVVSNVES